MKKCLRQKCQKEFEPNKPKQVFCSAKCRVYYSREMAALKKETTDLGARDLKVAAKAKDRKKTNDEIDTTGKSSMPDPKDKAAYLKWLRNN